MPFLMIKHCDGFSFFYFIAILPFVSLSRGQWRKITNQFSRNLFANKWNVVIWGGKTINRWPSCDYFVILIYKWILMWWTTKIYTNKNTLGKELAFEECSILFKIVYVCKYVCVYVPYSIMFVYLSNVVCKQ